MCFTTTTKNNNINIGTTTRTTCHAHWTDQDGVQQQQQQQQQQLHQQQQQQLPIFYIPAMLCEAIRMTLPSVVPDQLVQLEVLLFCYYLKSESTYAVHTKYFKEFKFYKCSPFQSPQTEN